MFHAPAAHPQIRMSTRLSRRNASLTTNGARPAAAKNTIAAA
jgi:hypothetical protein